MNRAARRWARSFKSPAGDRLRMSCVGDGGRGCPHGASSVVRATGGIAAIAAALEANGWVLAATRSTTQPELPSWFDPLCPLCKVAPLARLNASAAPPPPLACPE